MGILFQNYTLGSILVFALFVVICIALNEVARRSKLASIVLFGILPFVLAALVYFGVMGSPTGRTWFGWVKVVSALIGVYGFWFIRHHKIGKTKFAYYFPVTILALNIAEAVFREFEIFQNFKALTVDPGGILVVGGYWNVMNAVAGILTIVTLTGFVGIKVSKDKSKDMIWPDMTWLYIIGYTLWNFAYVYNCISTRSMYAGVGILLAAFLAEKIFKQGAWLQHRAQILTLYAMFSLSVDYQAAEVFQILPNYTESNMYLISSISLIFNIAVFAYLMYLVVKNKKNPLKEEMLSHTKYYQKTIVANNL